MHNPEASCAGGSTVPSGARTGFPVVKCISLFRRLRQILKQIVACAAPRTTHAPITRFQTRPLPMKFCHAIFLCLILADVAHARLGETEAELIARFGQPKSRSKDVMGAQGRMWDIGPKYIFYQGDWQITVCWSTVDVGGSTTASPESGPKSKFSWCSVRTRRVRSGPKPPRTVGVLLGPGDARMGPMPIGVAPRASSSSCPPTNAPSKSSKPRPKPPRARSRRSDLTEEAMSIFEPPPQIQYRFDRRTSGKRSRLHVE